MSQQQIANDENEYSHSESSGNTGLIPKMMILCHIGQLRKMKLHTQDL